MSRLSLAFSALAAVACACTAGGPDPGTSAPAADSNVPIIDPRAWSARSRGGGAEAEQVSTRDGRCQITARAGTAVLWSSELCVAGRGDAVFLSPDGMSLIAVEPLPEHQGPNWSGAAVLTLLSRGALVRRVTAGELVGAPRIQDMRRDYSWLRGVELGGEPSSAVRWTADGGGVVFETIDGRSYTVGFDGSGLQAALSPEQAAQAAQARAEAEAEAREASDTRTYRWEDAEGSTHYTKLRAVPRAFRARAAPVDSDPR
jgi:hypothetical protein